MSNIDNSSTDLSHESNFDFSTSSTIDCDPLKQKQFIFDFNSIIDTFWSDKVWKYNTNNLFHKKIYKIIHEFQKLKKKLDRKKSSMLYLLQ